MEGLGALGINWKILLGQIVNFLILLLILRKFLYRPIIDMLERRKKTIAKSLEDASEIEKKLAETDSMSREKLARAADEAQKIIDEAKKQATESSKAELAKTAEQAKKIIENAKSQAESEGKIAYNKARKDLAKLVTVAVEKITSEKQDTQTVERAIKRI